MNPVFIHTFDKSGALPVRLLFSAAGATRAPSRRTSGRPCLQFESCLCSSSAACAVRALPGPSRCRSRATEQFERCPARAVQFESCCAVRELLRSSRAAFAAGATRCRSDVRPLGSLRPRHLQLESSCAVRALPDPS